MDSTLSRPRALVCFGLVIIVWGISWPVTKIIVGSVSPLWTTAIRTAIAGAALLIMLLSCKQFVLPSRHDLRVVLVVSLFHMIAFSTLVATGLQYAPVGRSIVLGYTTPLWVAPAAWLLLGEQVRRSQAVGIVLGLAGLALMFNPTAFDWSNKQALLGEGLILAASLCWAVSIVAIRAHKWIASPFQLVFWQILLACLILTSAALTVDGVPQIAWTPKLAGALLYSGLCGTALGYWAMTMVNRALPAITTSLGTLATPVVGVAISALVMGEVIDPAVFAAMMIIVVGIGIGTIRWRLFNENSGPEG
jgi:drug/metabolite transporter (DMT)-like permease